MGESQEFARHVLLLDTLACG